MSTLTRRLHPAVLAATNANEVIPVNKSTVGVPRRNQIIDSVITGTAETLVKGIAPSEGAA